MTEAGWRINFHAQATQIGCGGAPGLGETTTLPRGPFYMRIYRVSSASARRGAPAQGSLRIYGAFGHFCEMYAFFSCKVAHALLTLFIALGTFRGFRGCRTVAFYGVLVQNRPLERRF